jgi:hypothetical protein
MKQLGTTVDGEYADVVALGGLASYGRAGIGDYGEERKGKGEGTGQQVHTKGKIEKT